MNETAAGDRRVRIGISACLLGANVRYDGGHKRNDFLVDTLGRFVDWVPICPEAESGLGTPREPMRLARVGDTVRLITVSSGRDVTSTLEQYAEGRVGRLDGEGLCGFVLKSDSPSCGLHRVKISDDAGDVSRARRGIFTSRLVERFPDLPAEEEGQLSDPRLCDNFIERVFAYSRLRELFASRWTIGALVRFHTAHKLIVMAHSPDVYRQLGRFVARSQAMHRADVERRYTSMLMSALAIVATPQRHTNVLQHMAGYFKNRLDAASKAELGASIEDYRCERVPRVVPMTLIRHHVRTHDVPYLARQLYLEPYPSELMIRVHASIA